MWIRMNARSRRHDQRMSDLHLNFYGPFVQNISQKYRAFEDKRSIEHHVSTQNRAVNRLKQRRKLDKTRETDDEQSYRHFRNPATIFTAKQVNAVHAALQPVARLTTNL